ncbi:MAG: D-alanine--D-alanine ligase [Pseudomonadota bacterium]
MNIEIITTPNEAMKETGFGTITACNSVLEVIDELGHNVKLNICTTKDDLDEIIARKPDLVVLAVKYIVPDKGDNIWISDYFDKCEINYTGSPKGILDFDSNKILAKTQLRKKGIRTADFFTAIPGQYKNQDELPIQFPLFIKPTDAANGQGVDDSSFVTNFSDFKDKVLSIYKLFCAPALVEEYLGGREFTVSIIKQNNNNFIVSPVEIVPKKSTKGLRILGEKAKKDDLEEFIKIDNEELKSRIKGLAIESFVGLNVKDYGRIDIKTNQSGDCFFMEANLVPGMTYGSSYFPKSCKIENELNYEKVVELMIAQGISRVEL